MLTIRALVAVGQTSLGFDDVFEDLGLEALDVPTSNSYGVELCGNSSDNFVLGGWVGYTN